ncbi:LCP family protein [Nocardioides yefusunii]|uniref:LCP family protein n=1 Tax=Nocardioides yefusunii TaxID=2500546 RepID=A0ABW1R0Q0_9ACTN|nr:LCP family protein [Nocardioides yefusunii]
MSAPTERIDLDVPERAARVRYRRAMAMAFMTLLVPGSAQLFAGRRRLGTVALLTWFLCVLALVAIGVTALVSPSTLLWMGTREWLMLTLRVVLVLLALGWAYLFVDAWRGGRPESLRRQHRFAVVLTNGVALTSVMSVLLFAAHLAGIQHAFLDEVGGTAGNKAAVEGRFNVLLAGGDAGDGRVGLRPDSLTVASIDAATGRTVLIGLPRNMSNFPFAEGSTMAEQFPDGWNCDECMLNGVSTWAFDHPDLFGDVDNVGMEATVQAVEGITDLEIGYWALVNLKGFSKLVDAFGGVELNVRDRIPVGLPNVDPWFRWIEPGIRTLDGEDTLWFARAREGSDDYSRMARQKCVMAAMLAQVDPTKAVRNIGKIAEASSEMLSTSMPSSKFNTFVELALQARNEKVSTVSLVPPAINTGNPDIGKAQRMVAKAIDRSENPKKKAKKKGSGTSVSPSPAGQPTVTGGSKGSQKQGYEANEADDLAASC